MTSPCSVPGWLRGIIPFETPEQQEICRQHDRAYECGGSRKDRLFADLIFCSGLLHANMDPDMAEKYLWAVRMYGASHWTGGDLAGALPPKPPEQIEAQSP